MVSSTPRPLFTHGVDPVPILQEAGWAPGPIWTGGKSRPHWDSIPDCPANSQSVHRQSYSAHVNVRVCVCVYIYIYIDTHTHTHTHTSRISNNTADSLIQLVFISFFYNPALLLISNRISSIVGAFVKLWKAIIIFAMSLSLSLSVCLLFRMENSASMGGFSLDFALDIYIKICIKNIFFRVSQK